MKQTVQETVPVTVNEKDVFGYNIEGFPELFGKVISRVYEGESVQRQFYVAEDTKREYRLGPTTTAFNFVDHVQALSPMLDQGYQIQKMEIMKAGLKMFTILTPKNPLQIDDPIQWDSSVWGGQKNQSLMETAVVSSSIGPGHGIHYSIGWFRMICSNGLISEILGTGLQKFSHLNWSNESLMNFMNTHRLSGDNATPIGNKKGIEKAKNLILDFKAEGDHYIPLPIQKTLEPIMSLPDWYQAHLDNQFSMILENHPKDEISTLDLMNVITSPISLEHEAGEDRTRFLFRTERVAFPLCQLIAFLSLGV